MAKAYPQAGPLSAHEAGKSVPRREHTRARAGGQTRYDDEDAARPAPRVTESEEAVLASVADNLTNAAIARNRRSTVATVEKHLENAYEKLGIHSRAEAAIWYLKRELRERDQIIAELQKLLAKARQNQM